MNTKNNRILCAFALIGMLPFFSLSADVIVVVNSESSSTSVAASDIEQVFLGKKRSLNGEKVKPVVLKSGAAHEEFIGGFINKSSSQFSAYWKRKIVDGTGIPPKSFSTEADLVEYVKKTPSAIGYVSSETPHDGLKTIVIN